MHRKIQQPKLSGADKNAKAGEVLPTGRGSPNDENPGKHSEKKAQGGKNKWGKFRQTPGDNDKIRSPDEHCGKGKQPMSNRQELNPE